MRVCVAILSLQVLLPLTNFVILNFQLYCQLRSFHYKARAAQLGHTTDNPKLLPALTGLPLPENILNIEFPHSRRSTLPYHMSLRLSEREQMRENQRQRTWPSSLRAVRSMKRRGEEEGLHFSAYRAYHPESSFQVASAPSEATPFRPPQRPACHSLPSKRKGQATPEFLPLAVPRELIL